MVAGKPTLSPTKITTYLACPVKYRWSYIDSRGKWYLRAKSYYSFGTSLHRALEKLHSVGDLGVPTTDEIKTAYEENWVDAGFSSAEEMAEAYNEGLDMLEMHVEQHRKRPIQGKAIFVERQFDLDMDKFRLIGRIDRVDEHPDGTLEIIDYKSGHRSITADEVGSDIAMGIYQLLLKRRFPERRIVATLYSLRTGEEASASMSDQEISDFERDIEKLGLIMLDEEYFELAPKWKPTCNGCDFRPLCRKHPEYGEPGFDVETPAQAEAWTE